VIRPSARGSDRGQLVVLAAAVVAVALVAMVAAYLQVAGATGAAGPAVADRGDPIERVHGAVRPAVYNASLAATGTGWGNRDTAATRVSNRLDPALDRIEDGTLADGRSVSLDRNDTLAAVWADERCPSGPNRQFGSCESIDGLVLQARGGEATLVAVALDVRVIAPGDRRTVGVVVTVP